MGKKVFENMTHGIRTERTFDKFVNPEQPFFTVANLAVAMPFQDPKNEENVVRYLHNFLHC